MIINTKHLGKIEIDENEIVDFEEGIPGFENEKKFVIIPMGLDLPFFTLQSVENQAAAFIVTSPFDIYTTYEFELGKNILEELQIQNEEQVRVYTILAIHGEMEKITANLKAPIVINLEKNIGKQIILENFGYDVRYVVYQKSEFNQKDKEGVQC